MTGWPAWTRSEPGELARYVSTGALTGLFPPEARPPGRSAAPPEVRVRQLFSAFAAAGIEYADEETAPASGEQQIRPPDQLFLHPARGNCLDLSVAFACGCLDAGLHPMIVTLTPAGHGAADHAIVVVWLRGDLGGAQPYPLTAAVHRDEPHWPGMGLRHRWDGPGEFVAIDVARVARGWPRPNSDGQVEPADAVAAGARMLTGADWTWNVAVDVGAARDVEAYHPPRRPTMEPLEPPYHTAVPGAAALGPLEAVRARNNVVPFAPRGVLDDLYDWCVAPDSDTAAAGSGTGTPPLRMIVLHGVGGAGKTRLAAELAARLAHHERWLTGFLRRELTRPSDPARPDDHRDALPWLAGRVGPLLVVIDYVEAADPEVLADALRVLATRRGRTVVLLTARLTGDWRSTLNNQLGSRGVHPEVRPDTPLDPLHPDPGLVFRRAYRRFAAATGARDDPPPLPAPRQRWTTLDVVMLAWLAAHAPDAALPVDRTVLHEEILGREFDNWDTALHTQFNRKAGRPALRRAAAAISLLSPTSTDAVAALQAVGIGELTSLAPGEITAVLGRFLDDPTDEVLALRPDPLADHLIVTEPALRTTIGACADLVVAALRDRDRPDAAPAERLVENLTRAGDRDRHVAGMLAAAVLGRHPLLWPAARDAALTRGGPFVEPLEELARHDDTPLPLAELARQIPMGHGALRPLALIAARRTAVAPSPAETDVQILAAAADALNTLSLRQSEMGERAAALSSITEAVTAYRALAEQNRAAFLPDLAASLNNLSVRQSELGERHAALTTITEAVTIRRALAEQNRAAFLPDLATSLNNLSVLQSELGERTAALSSITEAVTIRRTLAEQNPAAFLPHLATSLRGLADITVADGVAEARASWDRTASGLPSPTIAELLGSRSDWHLRRAEQASATADLRTAARLLDLGTDADPHAVARARQRIRASASAMDAAALATADLPDWAVAPLSDAAIERANAWLSADWVGRRQTLAEYEGDRSEIRLLAAVYCDQPAYQEWLDLLDAIEDHGQDAVFAELDEADATSTLIGQWFASPTWNASEAFLAGHPELRADSVEAALEQAGGDAVARQHLAVLRLTGAGVPAGAVFDAILDPTGARELLFLTARRGSAQLVVEAWFATPHLAADAFAAPLAVALNIALDEPGDSSDAAAALDKIDEAAAAAATAATTGDRRDALDLLRSLSVTRDDRAHRLARIATAFRAPTGTG